MNHLSSAEELAQIFQEIISNNGDRRRYLEKRGVLKAFYLGDDAIERHFIEVAQIHSREILDARQSEADQLLQERKKDLLLRENLLRDLQRRVEDGETYISFDADTRDCIEELDLWIRDEPLAKWTDWHLMAAKFIRSIPLRSEVLSFTQPQTKERNGTQWEYFTLSAKVKGGNWGILSAFVEHGLEEDATKRLQLMGREGWEVAGLAPVIYGGGGTAGTAVLIILKRPFTPKGELSRH